MYQDGEGVKQDHKKAIEYYMQAAQKGNDNAMVTFSLITAIFCFSFVSQNPFIKNILGQIYQLGKGVDVDYAKAVDYFQNAVAKGNNFAQKNLALMYKNGQGVPKNILKAVDLLQKSIEKGNAVAMHTMGMMFKNGDGLVKNLEKAKLLFQKAAKKGYAESKKELQELQPSKPSDK